MEAIILNVRGLRITIEGEFEKPFRIEIDPLTGSTNGAPIVPFPPRRGGSPSNMAAYEPHLIDPC